MSVPNELFQMIMHETFLGVLIFDRSSGKGLYTNRVAQEYLHVQADTEVRLSDLYPESVQNDRFRSFNKEFSEFEGLLQDIVISRSDKTQFVADVGIRNFIVGNVHYHVIMLRDVTLQKKLQRDLTAKQAEIQIAHQEMMKQNQSLKALDKAKDKFIALTTHELRTPLSAMIATAEVLTMNLVDSEEQRQEFIRTIHTEGLHLLEIVNDILDFSKIQAGKMDFYIEQKDVLPFVVKESQVFNHMANTKNIILKFEQTNEKFVAYYDSLRLKQAFDNILNNAIKFSPSNKTVHITLTQTAEHVLISIKDEGQGIPKEKQAKVFDEFETVANVNSHHKGTGLGLPITRKLVQNMGGDVLLDSDEGQGATFSIRLPKTRVLSDDLYRNRPSDADDLAA